MGSQTVELDMTEQLTLSLSLRFCVAPTDTMGKRSHNLWAVVKILPPLISPHQGRESLLFTTRWRRKSWLLSWSIPGIYSILRSSCGFQMPGSELERLSTSSLKPLLLNGLCSIQSSSAAAPQTLLVLNFGPGLQSFGLYSGLVSFSRYQISWTSGSHGPY